MKLLFSTDEAIAAQQLKDVLGYIDANIKFKNIRQDIIAATYELIDIIGNDLYNNVADLVSDNMEATTENDEYMTLRAFRYPIAVNAYRKYAPSNDLSHTGDGRKSRVEEGEKAAFEWMIDKDNKAHEKRYYSALDQMLSYIKGNDSLRGIWTNSDQYKKTQSLFVRSFNDFAEYFPIESSYLLLMLNPGLSACERTEIKTRIGADKYATLKQQLLLNEIPEDDQPLVDLIKEACVNYALAWAMPRMSVQLLPEGIMQAYLSDRMGSRATQVPVKSEAEASRQAFAATCQRALRDIEQLINKPNVDPATVKINPDIITGNTHFSA